MLTGSSTEICTFKGQGRTPRADRIGTVGLALAVLAAIAPLMVVAGVMPTAFAAIGIVGQPLLFVILGVVLVLFGVGYAEMSRHVHNAGALYAYVARGLGGTAGAGASAVVLAAYSAMQVGVYGLFGYEVSELIAGYAGVSVGWWVPALVAVAVIGVLGWRKIDLNAKVLGVLLLAECLMAVAFDAAAITHPAAEGLSLHAFNPQTLTGAGLGAALCFCIAGFIGFEHSAVYTEETSRPHVTIARVTFIVVGFVTVFFTLGSWALSVAVGPSRIVASAQEEGPGLLFVLAEARLGSGFTDVLHVFFATGMFACLLSFHNVVARYAFTMGRDGLLPSAFGRSHPTSGAPALGSLLQSAISMTVVAGFAFSDGKPIGDPTVPVFRLFAWMSNTGALGVVVLLAVTSAAVIAFFVHRGATRAQALRIACSAVAGAVLTGIAVYAVKDFGALLDTGPRSPLSEVLPGTIAAAALIGVVYGLVLKVTRPEVHARIGLGNQAFQLEKAAMAARKGNAPAGSV
jgi:amino acid transporter